MDHRFSDLGICLNRNCAAFTGDPSESEPCPHPRSVLSPATLLREAKEAAKNQIYVSLYGANTPVVSLGHLTAALAEVDRLTHLLNKYVAALIRAERDEEYEVISSEDRTEYSLVTVDTAPDDPRRIGCPRVVRRFRARSWEQATGWYEATMEDDGARAEDVARIVEWVRTQADESRVELGQQQSAEEIAYLRGEWIALTAIADAIERGDWRTSPDSAQVSPVEKS